MGSKSIRSITFFVKRVLRQVAFSNVYYAVDVEGDLLRVGAPVLVAEAVYVFSVVLRIEGEVAIGN